MNKYQIVILALIGLSIILLQFIIVEKWDQENDLKMNEMLKQGYGNGAVNTITDLLDNTNECKVAKITFENFTRGVVDIKCLESVNMP